MAGAIQANAGASYLWGFAAGEINKESVRNAVFLSSPYDTPLAQLAPKVPATQTTEYWIEDTLDATSIAGLPEGRTFSATAAVAPVRKSNHTQIFGKDMAVTLTQMKLASHGFTDAMMREVTDGTKEVLRNIEKKMFSAAGASATGSEATVRVMKNIEDFVTTNKYNAGSALLGGIGSNACATALHEDVFNTLLQKIYEQGGNPTHVFVPPASKRAISSWQGSPVNVTQADALAAGNPTTFNIQQGSSILGRSVSTYLSDFGMLNIVLDRWVPQGANAPGASTSAVGRVFVLDLNKFEVGFLRDLAFVPLAPAGDFVHGQITGELTIRVINEGWHGILTHVDNVTFA